ncbi:alkene reductase [Rhizobium leguminosarum]
MTSLFEPFDLSGLILKNRIVMAPMTRARRPNLIPDATTAEYYRQRAGAGLIVSEGTPVSQEARGYIGVPGIWSAEQVNGWRSVTRAVHDAGSAIYAQLWHVGRVSHTLLQPDGRAPVSSTNVPVRDAKTRAYVYLENGEKGFVEPSIPRPLETGEISRVIEDFVKAAQNAVAAGFDGVEIHAANGYLFEQFLNPVLNDRSDIYGGSTENRARLALETVDAIAAAIGSRRVGIRLAPFNRQFDMPAYDATDTYLHLGRELAERDMSYVHLNDNHALGESIITKAFLAEFRSAFVGTVVLAGAMTKERANELVGEGLIDLPAFGRPFIANPDLVARLEKDIPLAIPDQATFYGGGEEGYTDYPPFDA